MGVSKGEKGKCKNKGDLRRMLSPTLKPIAFLEGDTGGSEHCNTAKN